MNARELSDEERVINRQYKRKITRVLECQAVKRRRDALKADLAKFSPEKKKDAATKCFKCGRKLRLTNNFVCRCGHIFCPIHRFFDQHGCQFDIKGVSMKRLKEENPQVVNKKITEF